MGWKRAASVAAVSALLCQLTVVVLASGAGAAPPDRARPAFASVGSTPRALDGPTPAAPAGDPKFEAYLRLIEGFTCDAGGDPARSVDMSCNSVALSQDFTPDNEIAMP